MDNQIYTKKVEVAPDLKSGELIWSKLFLVSIKYKYLQSDDELRMFGLSSVYDTDLDNSTHNQLIDIMINIDKMVEYYRKGITVNIKVHSDTKIIYNIINEYLFAWKNRLNNGINIGIAPLDDLLLLDQFAGSIYSFAKDHFRTEDESNKLVNQLGGKNWFSRTIFDDKPVEENTIPDKHNSMAKIISERVIGRNKKDNTDNSLGGLKWK